MTTNNNGIFPIEAIDPVDYHIYNDERNRILHIADRLSRSYEYDGREHYYYKRVADMNKYKFFDSVVRDYNKRMSDIRINKSNFTKIGKIILKLRTLNINNLQDDREYIMRQKIYERLIDDNEKEAKRLRELLQNNLWVLPE